MRKNLNIKTMTKKLTKTQYQESNKINFIAECACGKSELTEEEINEGKRNGSGCSRIILRVSESLMSAEKRTLESMMILI